MNSISQNYEYLLKKIIKRIDCSKLNVFQKFERSGDILNYVNFSDALHQYTKDFYKELFESLIIELDQKFMQSDERLENYESGGYRVRHIQTLNAYVEIKRRVYIHKETHKCYYYIDNFLGLPPKTRFDPCVVAEILNEASDNNSMMKVGKIVGRMINFDSSLKKDNYSISRQTVKNIILRANKNNFEEDLKELDTPESIFVMADEKWISNQREQSNKTMVKSIVIYDDKKTVCKGRNVLINKHTISKIGSSTDIWQDALSYIDYVYDEDKLQNIYILGDGAPWIKSGIDELNFNKNIKIIYIPDYFHIKQALNNITINSDIKVILFSYICKNKKVSFTKVINALIQKYPDRKDVIESKTKYIFNNWRHLQTSLKLPYGCCMESQISHTYASIFANLPKGYRINTIEALLKLRTMFVNNSNIRLNYFNSLRPNDYNSFDDIPISNTNKTLISDCKVGWLHSTLKSISSFKSTIQPS